MSEIDIDEIWAASKKITDGELTKMILQKTVEFIEEIQLDKRTHVLRAGLLRVKRNIEATMERLK